MLNKTKVLLHFLGGILALVSIYFVCGKIFEYTDQVDLLSMGLDNVILLVILAIIYAMACLMLSESWRFLVNSNDVDMSSGMAYQIYGLSQLAKYVPGNVMHFAGRQAIAMSQGFSGRIIAKSMLLEIIVSVLAGITYSCFLLLLIPYDLSFIIACILFLLCALAIYFILSYFLCKNVAKSYLLWVLFLLVSGGIFSFLLKSSYLESTTIILSVFKILGAFIIAWLIGMITPGAPAGIGVREIILITLLSDIVPENALILAIVLSRLVTVVGDLLFFSCASFSRWKVKVNT